MEGINWNNDGLIEANEMRSGNTLLLLFSSPFLITLNRAITLNSSHSATFSSLFHTGGGYTCFAHIATGNYLARFPVT